MSDVNQAVQAWRSALSGEEAISAPILDELQDHLETELTRLTTDELSHEERVLIAARRVGAPDKLGQQFMTNPSPTVWARRFYWAVLGWILFKIPAALAGFCGTATLGSLSVLGLLGPEIGMAAGITSSVALILAWLFLLGVGWRHLSKGRPTTTAFSWIADQPHWILGILLLFLVGISAANKLLISPIVIRYVTPEQWGNFALWQSPVAAITWLCIPLVLVFLATHRMRHANGWN